MRKRKKFYPYSRKALSKIYRVHREAGNTTRYWTLKYNDGK